MFDISWKVELWQTCCLGILGKIIAIGEKEKKWAYEHLRVWVGFYQKVFTEMKTFWAARWRQIEDHPEMG